MRRTAALAVVLLACARPAHSDDQPFLTLSSTDIDSEGEHELEQSLAW
jgi:hypothetical protein